MTDRNSVPPDLIDQLVSDLRPVRVRSARRLALQFGLRLAVPAVVSLSILGLQPRALKVVLSADVVVSMLVLIAGVALGSVLLARWSRPGLPASRRLAFLFAGTLAAALAAQLVRLGLDAGIATWGPAVANGWVCSCLSLGMSALTGALAFALLRHEAPVNPVRAGVLAFLTTSAIAALVLQVHCPNGNPLHILLWHFLAPGLLVAALAVPASRLALRW